MNEKALAMVNRLRDCDHLFISPKFMAECNEAFGTTVQPHVHRANHGPGNPKGLMLNDGAKSAEGMCAAQFAELCSDELNTGFESWQSGRGFRLRSACDALEKHFKKETV
jgi:hypothetical protein